MAQIERRHAASAHFQSTVFGAVSEAVWRRMTEAASTVRLAPDELLFDRGDAGDAAFLVVSGELEALATIEDGRSMRLASFGPGAVVGELSVLDGEPRSAGVRATRRSELLRIPRQSVLDALEADPAAALALMRTLARRLRSADVALAVQAWGGLTEKLARLLVSEAGATGLAALTQSEMARRLGVARENVNRRLRAWRAEGVIATGKSGVRVLQRERLAHAAGMVEGD